ncbi:Response regulator of citrate/malate metabolism [Pseudonocardia thermophila]|uniref:Transcriptional regulatory protein n=1 Tax=Pseudonocardia thermophila TaxID=1848 RepID=A0A1M6ZFX3_PSETH|nr:response regulator [Pseudonocardia thermophila]SHL29382.1 Response regulator of citrate/malate metabolism [Pseudonocardia thermophila]
MIRTLVVEDDPVAREAHVAYVRRVPGFTVAGAAGTGAEALRLLASTGVDLVLLDVHLPDTSGLELLRRMRAEGRTADVIMVTRARDVEVVRAAVAFGATQYLVKPFTFSAVAAKLASHRAYVERLRAEPVLAQGDVDELFDALRAPGPDPGLPPGISRESLDAVSGVLEAAGAPLTAAEVAERLGASRVTARRYLEHLADIGVATRQSRYGSQGRPQVEYVWRG